MTQICPSGPLSAADDFNQACDLVCSYAADGGDESISEMFRNLRELYPQQFDKILLLGHVITRHGREFDHFGVADAGTILRSFEPTADIEADAIRFLSLMQEESNRAWREAHEEADPYHRAAVRLMQFRNPTICQVMYELARL